MKITGRYVPVPGTGYGFSGCGYGVGKSYPRYTRTEPYISRPIQNFSLSHYNNESLPSTRTRETDQGCPSYNRHCLAIPLSHWLQFDSYHALPNLLITDLSHHMTHVDLILKITFVPTQLVTTLTLHRNVYF